MTAKLSAWISLAVVVTLFLCFLRGGASTICGLGGCQTVGAGEGPLSTYHLAPYAEFNMEDKYSPASGDSAYCRHMQYAMSRYPYQAACRPTATAEPQQVDKKKKYKTTKPIYWYTSSLTNYFKIDADNIRTLRFTHTNSDSMYAVTCYNSWDLKSTEVLYDDWNPTYFRISQDTTARCVFTLFEVQVTPACTAGESQLWLDGTIRATQHFTVLMRTGGKTAWDNQGDAIMKSRSFVPGFVCDRLQEVRDGYRTALHFQT